MVDGCWQTEAAVPLSSQSAVNLRFVRIGIIFKDISKPKVHRVDRFSLLCWSGIKFLKDLPKFYNGGSLT